MRTKAIFRLTLTTTIALAGLAGCDDGSGSGKNVTVKVGTVLQEDHPTAASLLFFKDRLAELSGGQMQVQVYFNSQLGAANEVLEGCRDGSVEMAQVSTATISNYIPLANALAMPYIWRDSEHQAEMLDGKVGQIIRDKAQPHGLDVLGFFDAGTRNVTTKTGPIQQPKDLNGMNIRVMGAPLMVDTINALGANATPMNQGEVYTALQMGVLDGWENNPLTIVSFRMYETGCIYFAWTRHFSIPDVFVAGQPFLERLDEQQAEWLDQAVHDTIVKQREMWKASEQEALEVMVENGMKINEVETDAFRARVEPIYKQYYDKYGEEFKQLCDQIRSGR